MVRLDLRKRENELNILQKLPLETKEAYALEKIKEWYEYWDGKVYVSFSGGKDSTVLLHLIRSVYPNVVAVFCDTGLEWPEIRDFVKTIDNVVWIKPKKSFKEILEEDGYPIISKEIAQKVRVVQKCLRNNGEVNKIANYYLTGYRSDGVYKKRAKIPNKWMFLTKAPFNISEKCCDWMKKKPLKHFVKGGEYKGFKPFIGILASESQQRRLNWTKYKCNAFGKKNMESMPLSIWLDDDIWAYIEKYNLDYSKIYDRGIARTGCIFCMFGVNLEEENRFEILRELHPKIYKYCINALGVGKVLDYLGIKYHDSKLIHHKNLKKRRKLK